MLSTQAKSTASFALSAALLALASTSFAADAPKGSKGAAIGANDTVHCYNVHDCKGNSDCSTAEHSCKGCLLYTSPSPRDQRGSRMPSSA